MCIRDRPKLDHPCPTRRPRRPRALRATSATCGHPSKFRRQAGTHGHAARHFQANSSARRAT
eukprot:8326930-Alexandrium_andersonii.AAC.1